MNTKLFVKLVLLSTIYVNICCTALNNSVESQTTYLDEILQAHNNAIEKTRLANKKYGYKSKTHIMAERKKAAINKENVLKIEQFLQSNGHPTEKLHGSKLADLPYTIFIASPKSKKIILRNLSHINDAWKKKSISDRTYLYYLQSLHRLMYKQKLELNNPYTEKQELESLIVKLKIDSLLNSYN